MMLCCLCVASVRAAGCGGRGWLVYSVDQWKALGSKSSIEIDALQ